MVESQVLRGRLPCIDKAGVGQVGVNEEPWPGLFTIQGLKSRVGEGQVEKRLGPGALPISLITGTPCPLSSATGAWCTGQVGFLNRRHAVVTGIQLCPGPRVRGGHVASLCKALPSWAPRDPPGFRWFRCPTSPVPQL